MSKPLARPVAAIVINGYNSCAQIHNVKGMPAIPVLYRVAIACNGYQHLSYAEADTVTVAVIVAEHGWIHDSAIYYQ